MSEVLPPVVDRFLAYIQLEKRYSAHTVVAYQQDLIQFFTFIRSQYGDVSLSGISHLHVRTWLAGLMEEGMIAKTVNRKVSTLKSLFKYALRQGEITQTPMTKVTAPKSGSRLPHFIEEKGMQAIEDNRSMRKGREDQVIFGDDLAGKTHRMIFELLYHTGIRLSELIELKSVNADISRLTIKVMGKGGKERIIPISPLLATLMNEYRDAKKRELAEFDMDVLLVHPESGRKLYPKYVYRVVRHYLSAHGITTISEKSPHTLRHTFATHLMNNGADLNAVKELLGHASLASTQVYTHNTIEKLKEAYKKAHPKG
ncbi:tyrosine-type recombinase/integrase [Chitinophaga sancti]|uniref:Integrase/recombinase XerC n=1 Tax=Chitinophaga sancti TaxID=1004 RepID=A0A1K1QBK3_9BACT|nr:tyrosine-type recombinase/integrase [Chitinophaga sancti]WQD61346.1 tyrosine-type recombinase/integrase [Chitinophaga sancti]WQG93101.1 tyrosine-type recombinase/integrase [Chitinophaga sancti]SFW57295.1 integrase/recombinase XerC [Chitinophaga sancti]